MDQVIRFLFREHASWWAGPGAELIERLPVADDAKSFFWIVLTTAVWLTAAIKAALTIYTRILEDIPYSWRWVVFNGLPRFVLLGPRTLVIDFLVLAVGLIVVIVIQAVGLVPRVPLAYNLRNLVVRWRTTLLTGVAFTLITGLMTVMLAFVNGMYAVTKGSSVPGNIMIVADGSTDEIFSDLGHGSIRELSTKTYIKELPADLKAQQTEERMISWEMFQLVNQRIANATPGGRQRRFVQVRGVEKPVISALVHNLSLKEGAWFDPARGIQSVPGKSGENYIQGVLGEGLARAMGHDFDKSTLAVGDTFELGPEKWVVVGIMKSAGRTYDSEAWAKLEKVGQMYRKDNPSTVVIRARDDLEPGQLAKDITADFKSPAVMARTETDYYEALNGANQTFLIAIIFVAVMMAVGGVFGVMNTMFAAIAQRTRDIGVMRILGFARWQILVSFFLEALLLALVGGVIGCALGSIVDGWSATSQISSSSGGGKSVMLKMVVDARIMGAGLGFSLLMGCIGGLLPALSAIRMKVLDMLR
jgi:ABC-type lipoprotein release transport system permease subunit